VTSVNDLAKSSVKVALCQPQVPCGVVAAQVFKNVGITVKPVTLQPDVLTAADSRSPDLTSGAAVGSSPRRRT